MTANQPVPPKLPITGVKLLIAVGSGKGCRQDHSFRSTWRLRWLRSGHKAGLMNADVYGPTVPLMMGINRTPMAHGERIQPLEQFGVKLMSMSFMNCPHCHNLNGRRGKS